MKKIGIFYGSSTGNTEQAAELIAQKLEVDSSNVINVDKAKGAQLLDYDILLLGSSTWGVGDLQDDWDGFISNLQKQDLSGKEVGVFGSGDSASYSDSFCDALGIIAEAAEKAGARIVGKGADTADYSFDDSRAAIGGQFIGLPLDFDNEDDKTEERVEQWITRIKADCGL
ncbi:MAG: flavodoxin [Dysgonamonadaceae bacterium]|nr:flavodoxin [Dysgonamonadaceae bacterium]